MSSPYLLAKELRQTLTNISCTHTFTGDLKFESLSGSQTFTKSLWIVFSNYAGCLFLFDLPRTVELVPLSASRVVCLFGETMGGLKGFGMGHFFPPKTCGNSRPCGGASSLRRCEPSWKISIRSDLAPSPLGI